MADQKKPEMDAKDLWREDIFTDRKVGTIRRLEPVKLDGSKDPARQTIFTGEAQLLTPAGALPLAFEIPADTLEQAVAGYGPAVEKAFNEAMDELKEMRRKASSQIVVPGAGGMPPGGLGGGGLGGLGGAGGLPPGKLKL